jgi:hypothetical protein
MNIGRIIFRCTNCSAYREAVDVHGVPRKMQDGLPSAKVMAVIFFCVRPAPSRKAGAPNGATFAHSKVS